MCTSLHVMYPLFWSDFNQNWISRQIFQKSSNIEFPENMSSGRRIVPRGRADRHDEANSHFTQFCEHTKIPRKRIQSSIKILQMD